MLSPRRPHGARGHNTHTQVCLAWFSVGSLAFPFRVVMIPISYSPLLRGADVPDEAEPKSGNDERALADEAETMSGKDEHALAGLGGQEHELKDKDGPLFRMGFRTRVREDTKREDTKSGNDHGLQGDDALAEAGEDDGGSPKAKRARGERALVHSGAASSRRLWTQYSTTGVSRE